jgi:Tol biopolymer transport system component
VASGGVFPLKVGKTKVTFEVVCGLDARKSKPESAQVQLHPTSYTPSVPSAYFTLASRGAPGTDLVSATTTNASGQEVSATASVQWVKPVPCGQPLPKLGYLLALQCKLAAAKPLVDTVLQTGSCALGVATFFVPVGKIAKLLDEAGTVATAGELAKDSALSTPVPKLVFDLRKVADEGIPGMSLSDIKNTFEDTKSVPAFLEAVVGLVSKVAGYSKGNISDIALDVADLTGLGPCVELLAKIVGSSGATSTTTAAAPRVLVRDNGDSVMPLVSPDGRFVAFASDAPTAVPSSGTNPFNMFVLNRATGALTKVTDCSGRENAPPDPPQALLFTSGDDDLIYSPMSCSGTPTSSTGGQPYVSYNLRTGRNSRVSTAGYSALLSAEQRYAIYEVISQSSSGSVFTAFRKDRVTNGIREVLSSSQMLEDLQISRNGSEAAALVYSTATAPTYHLVTVDLGTNQQWRDATPIYGVEATGDWSGVTMVLSGNGQTVAFNSYTSPNPKVARSVLYTMPTTGGRPTESPAIGQPLELSITNNGKVVVYQSLGANDSFSICQTTT